jgi:hypothetical protein
MNSRSSPLFLAAALLILPAVKLGAETVSLRVLGFDSGGGRVVSASYRGDSSLGGFGGLSHIEGAFVAVEHGYAGLLNDPPIARADALVRRAGETKSRLSIAQLVANDTDLEHDRLNLTSLSARSQHGGSVVRDGDWIEYLPPARLSGIDAFDYTISDAYGDKSVGRVYVLPHTGAEPWDVVLHAASPPPGAAFRLLAQIPVSPKVVLAATEDLRSWRSIQTNAPAAEVAEFVVAAGGSTPTAQSFRAVSRLIPGPALRMNSVQVQPDNTTRLIIGGTPQLRTVLETSFDLVRWTPVLTNISVPQTITFHDASAAGAASLFYRASAAP